MNSIHAQTQMQRMLSATLRCGVLLASVIGLSGGISFLYRHGSEPVLFHHFTGARSPFATSSGIVAAVLGADDGQRWLAIIQIGIIVLLLTPIVRVGLSLVSFAVERDRTYALITTLVFLTLLSSTALH